MSWVNGGWAREAAGEGGGGDVKGLELGDSRTRLPTQCVRKVRAGWLIQSGEARLFHQENAERCGRTTSSQAQQQSTVTASDASQWCVAICKAEIRSMKGG